MAHDSSSPLAGILMTAFFGIISTVLGVVTMYQVHSLWVKYHHQRKENRDLDIEQRDSSVCLPTTDTEEWQNTPETSLRPIVDQVYTIPHRHHGELLPPDEGITTITTRCLAGNGDEGTCDLSMGVISRFSTDSSDSNEGEGNGWGEGIQAPPSTPESERTDEKEGM